MHRSGYRFLVLTFAVAILLGAGSMAAAEEIAAVEPDLGVCLLGDEGDPELTPMKGKPPKTACCDPDLEPGVGGNPLCFEGHTCCSDGRWSCNNPDGTPSCDPGEVCVDCGARGDSCSTNEDCCSGACKGNGVCR